jgi:hypothetical protein
MRLGIIVVVVSLFGVITLFQYINIVSFFKRFGLSDILIDRNK